MVASVSAFHFCQFYLQCSKVYCNVSWDRLNVRYLAGIAIEQGRPTALEILGLKKKTSLQGLAGEVLTICKGQGQQSDRSAPAPRHKFAV